ncbi:hypothetical protein BTJ40_12865 [Microbulbifer sp. A4B17]|uniref:FG-GAP-like repeat-containing protein n=1 Tax=Microbulbifer sp. A4B17 TaxID=359370 RepID=UPI000D52C20E|nr:FG-GAP-like repeat-containing protein [Microbulbifer sp. A4B17]AWF81645.1 hypothetical protein BTJ40_12865 [Microbulbifer sp. A4B17]
MRVTLAYLCLVVAGLFSSFASASSGIWENGYEIYSGDINNDGLNDLYFEYHRPFIILHGKVATPVAMPELPNFVLYGTRDNGGLGYGTPQSSTLTETILATLEKIDGNLSFSGDFDGDGEFDLLVLAATPLVLQANGNGFPTLSQVFPIGDNTEEIALILSGADPESLRIEDANGDGRDDILVQGVIDATLLASTSGTFDSHGTPLVTNSTNMAGASGGEFRVNEMGAVTYSIPIMAASGTGGVTPQLSLSYSSNGGNGLLGKGWTIGGLSGISRCRQTLAIDGRVAPINWTDSDRFCLDGQRLIKVSGSAYGAVGAVYKTEMDSFAKVTSVGGSLGKPAYFTVERKDGSLSYYGNSSTSKLLAGSHVLVWAQNQFEDSVGNHIDFQYEGNADSGQRIKRIRYAYGSGSYGGEVEFSYTTRPDYLQSYTSGYEFITTKRLEKITSRSNGSVIREYNLGYKPVGTFGSGIDYSDRTSLLSSFQECVGSSCLPAMSFEWLQSPLLHDGTAHEAIDFSPASSRFLVNYKYADINGDGKQDLVWIEGDADGDDTDTRVKYAISDGTKFVKQNFSGSTFDLAYFSGINIDKDFAIRVLDYNGDGRQDLAIFNARQAYQFSGGYWHVFLSRYSNGAWRLDSDGIYTGLNDKDAIFADFNGDGLADYISTATAGSVKVRLLVPAGLSESSDRYYKFSSTVKTYDLNVTGATVGTPDKRVPDTLGDFNGDGSIDLLVATYTSRFGCVTVNPPGGGGPPTHEPFLPRQLVGGPDSCGTNQQWTFLGNYFDGYRVAVFDQEEQEFNSSHLLSASSEPESDPIAIDINGDGLTDIAYITGSANNLAIKLSTGSGFVSLGSFPDGEKATFADLNNDGFPDLVRADFDTGYAKVRYFDQNTGNFVSTERSWKYIGTDKRDFIWFADTNGDGQVDYHRYDQSSGKVRTQIANEKYAEHKNKPSKVINVIDNGLGNLTEVTYENMVDGDVYTRLSMSSTHEERCVRIFNSEDGFGGGSIGGEVICYTVSTPNPSSLYSELNGDWELPSGSHTLGKSKPVFDILAPIFLVSKVESSAPAAGINSGSVAQLAKSSISYHYHQMKLQAAGRGALGFQKVSSTDNQTGVITETTYRQDFPFTGVPLHTVTRTAQGKILSQATNNWRLQGWNGSGTPSAPYQPFIYSAVENTYDLKDGGESVGDLLQTVTTTNSYDNYGNALTINVTTTDAATNEQFVKKVVNVYGNSTWEKEMGRLSNTRVTNTRPGMTSHIQESSFTYYTSGIHKGLLRTEVVEPNKSAFKQTTTYDYDSFGNVSKKTLSASGEASRSARTVYDPSGRYVTETYNALNHLVEKVVSRNHFGAPLIVEGVNGLMSYFAYDALGREGYSWNNAGVDKETKYERCTSGCPSGAKYRITTSSSSGKWGREYFDVLGRSIRTETQGLYHKIYMDKEYDNLGRAKFISEPYFSGDTPMWTETEYDLLGRPTRVIAPDDSDSTIVYLGLKTITTNDKVQKKTEIKNIVGELVEVLDANNGRLTYEYDSQGNLHKAKSWGKTNSSGSHIDEGDGISYPIVVTINHDHLGRKLNMDDPDKGFWEYEYTGYGELEKQTNANGHTVALTYDKLGRQLTRIEKEGGTSITSDVSWFYDSAHNGVGQIEMIIDSVTGYQAVYQYDYLGRNNTQAVDFDGGGPQPTYITTKTFDDYGRVERSYDALDSLLNTGQSGIRNYYKYGLLYKTVDLATGNLIQEIKAHTARGQLKEQLLGNGATTVYTYQDSTGRLLNQTSTVLGTFGVQNITYQWDTLGNLVSRHNRSSSKNLRESFCYDNLNRLIKNHIGSSNYNCSTLSSGNQDIKYNAIGNITYKAGVGSYIYGQNDAGAHAVTTAGGIRYNYDANGNMTSDGFDGGRTIRYTTFDKASWIKKGNHTTEFLYGPSHGRYYRKDTNSSNGEVTETWYIGGVERVQKSSTPNEIQWKRYLGGGALYTVKTDVDYVVQSTEKMFLYKDHLGSMDLITDESGTVKQEMAFDAWGQRRNTGNWNALSNTALTSFDHGRTTRGYTGHEMLDEVGLIHMNGRIYDARLGRFVQADPFIQAAADTQMYNRYSYVRNNPLNATDPSGYFLSFISKAVTAVAISYADAQISKPVFKVLADNPALATAAQIIGSVVSAIYCGPCSIGFNAQFSKNMAYAQSDDFGVAMRAAAISGATSAAFYGVGSLRLEGATKIIAHGIVGGTMAHLQGGKFGHGFAAAGFSALASNEGWTGPEGMGPTVDGVIVSAVVGGTASVLSGGKFANGAVTGAFRYVLNDALHNPPKTGAQEKWKQRYELLRFKVFKGVQEGSDTPIQLSQLDIITIAEYMSIEADGVNPLNISEFSENFISKADTFLYGYANQEFYVDNIGVFKGGEINYIGVGVFAGRYGFSEATLNTLVGAWNVNDVLAGKGSYNLYQAQTGGLWSRFGRDYYNIKR